MFLHTTTNRTEQEIEQDINKCKVELQNTTHPIAKQVMRDHIRRLQESIKLKITSIEDDKIRQDIHNWFSQDS